MGYMQYLLKESNNGIIYFHIPMTTTISLKEKF